MNYWRRGYLASGGSAINPGAAPAPVNMLDWIPEEFLSPSFEPTAIVDPLRTET